MTLATKAQREELAQLVKKAGNVRKAHTLLTTYKNTKTPTYGGFNKNVQGRTIPTDYVMQCYIDDLTNALRGQHNEKN